MHGTSTLCSAFPFIFNNTQMCVHNVITPTCSLAHDNACNTELMHCLVVCWKSMGQIHLLTHGHKLRTIAMGSTLKCQKVYLCVYVYRCGLACRVISHSWAHKYAVLCCYSFQIQLNKITFYMQQSVNRSEL